LNERGSFRRGAFFVAAALFIKTIENTIRFLL
jgi:hypothetical protein